MKELQGTALTRYWRLVNSDTWHWYGVCPIYRRSKRPHGEMADFSKRPSYGELCNCCLAIERRTQKG